jgi:1-deoxy-D-xylulose-5-phosphate synthase
VDPAMKAAALLESSGISSEVVNMRFAKPLDVELLASIASRHGNVVTIENNSLLGGFGSAVAEHFAASGVTGVRLMTHGITDRFVDHGSPAELAAELRLDPKGIAEVVTEFLRSTRGERPRPVAVG